MGELPQPGESFGRYRIERELGRGAMGVVLAATQVELEREVALKLMTPQLIGTPELVERFRREAKALARLDSANVVAVYDAGEHEGWLYIATQLVPGGDLAGYVAARGPLRPRDALGLLDQILAGLADAHEVSVLHRDIKPSNVLLRADSTGLRSYLCDFGIAQLEDVEGTQTQGVVGTWAYLAPERLDGHPATARSDLYSAGCLLWFLVTGAVPYPGTMAQQVVAHHTSPLPVLPAGDPWVGAVNAMLGRLMAKDPDQRPPTAAHARALLRSLSDGVRPAVAVLPQAEPTLAAPQPPRLASPPGYSPPPTVAPVPERRTGMIAGVVALALLLVAGMVGGAMLVTSLRGDDPAAGAEATKPSGRPTSDSTPAVVEETVTATATATTTVTPTPTETPGRAAGPETLDQAFPSLGGQRCLWAEDDEPGRVEKWECTASWAGSSVTVLYSAWTSGAGAAAYYDSWTDPGPYPRWGGEQDGIVRWAGINQGSWKVTWLYVDAGFSANVWLPASERATPDELIAAGVVTLAE